jgi:hypothetical protein
VQPEQMRLLLLQQHTLLLCCLTSSRMGPCHAPCMAAAAAGSAAAVLLLVTQHPAGCWLGCCCGGTLQQQRAADHRSQREGTACGLKTTQASQQSRYCPATVLWDNRCDQPLSTRAAAAYSQQQQEPLSAAAAVAKAANTPQSAGYTGPSAFQKLHATPIIDQECGQSQSRAPVLTQLPQRICT